MSDKASKSSDSGTPARLASVALLTGLAAGALLGASDTPASGETPSNEASSIQQQFEVAFAPGLRSSNPVSPIVVCPG
jgi:hypothetical protein